MALDLENPGDFDGMRPPSGRRSGAALPPAETFHAISEVDAAKATSEATGERATFEH